MDFYRFFRFFRFFLYFLYFYIIEWTKLIFIDWQIRKRQRPRLRGKSTLTAYTQICITFYPIYWTWLNQTLPGAHLVLLSNGMVYYIPPLSLTTPCELDLTNWPFDEQSCTLRFGAWSHDSTEIILGILDNQTEVRPHPSQKPQLLSFKKKKRKNLNLKI